MINGTYGSNVASYLSLLERKINTEVADANLRWLFKFTNDLTKKVKYCYGRVMLTPNDRYVQNNFNHNATEDPYTNRINFKPYGFWGYEVYEVSWVGDVALSADTAPANETIILEVSEHNGVVEGKVHEGKLYITETSGDEQVKYIHHTEATTNYLYTDY